MAKDINIHLKTTGAAQTRQQLRETADSAQQVGQKTAEGSTKGAEATEQATQKMGGMGRVLSSLKSQVLGFVAGWLGIQTILRLLDAWVQKMERVKQLQSDIYQQGLSLAEIGQALEIQTGTTGMQQFWTQKALEVQKAGALASAEIAKNMLVSMDIAMQKLGGIKSEQVMDLAKELAPYIGAAGFQPDEVSRLFKFAGTAKVEPTAGAYKDYFAKILTAFRSAESENIGQFMTGLQKGGTAYMALGGTLEETLSAYVSAISVTAGEQLAGTLIEQVARLSAGGYEKPRMAIEKGVGVKWPELSMDQRMKALLQYVSGIPEERRAETLAAQGFPMELTTQIGKMVSDKAAQTMAAAREQVATATGQMIDDIIQSYLDSMLAQQRQTEAQIAQKQVVTAPKFADWQQRFQQADAEFKDRASQYLDTSILDSWEPYVIAYGRMVDELDRLMPTLPEGAARAQAEKLRADIVQSIQYRMGFLLFPITKGMSARAGQEYAERLKAFYKSLGEQGISVEPTLPTGSEGETYEEMVNRILGGLRQKELPTLQKPPSEPSAEKHAPVEPVAKAVLSPVPQQVGVEPEITQPGPVEPELEVAAPARKVAQRIEVEPEVTGPGPVAPELEVAAPVKAVAKVTPAEPVVIAAQAEVEPTQVEAPVKAVAKVTPAEPVTPAVPTEAQPQDLPVPVEAVAKVEPAEPIAAEPELGQLVVETERIVVRETSIPSATVVHNYYFDSSVRYYPRVGDDERGPRFSQVG